MASKTRRNSKNAKKLKTPELYDSDVSAKDSFLKNAELKAMTFSYLQVKKKCRFLLNVALACKDFLDVALDALWEELDSLLPLLKLLPALQFKNKAYVLSGNVSQADWDRLQFYSRKVKFFIACDTNDQVHPSTYFRIAQRQSSALLPSLRHLHFNLGDASISSDSHIFFFQSPLLDSIEFINSRGFENTIVGPFLATVSSEMLSRIVLRSGWLSVGILKDSIVHFKQLRSLELSDAVIMKDFGLLEDLGALPSLKNFTFVATDPASHPAEAPGNSNSQSGGLTYFDALENLSVTGSFFLIQHLLGFIDSPYLKSIKVYPIVFRNREHDEDPFTPSMTIVASKWSHSLTDFVISTNRISSSRTPVSKCLMLLSDFHELQTFHLLGWKMENNVEDVRRLVMSWPKLRSLNLNRTFLSLSTLRIIAENCPDLRFLEISLNVSIIPPFDASVLRLSHDLEVLTVARVLPASPHAKLELQIQTTRHLDLIFPYLKTIKVEDEDWLEIRDLVKLCQDVRRF